MTDNLLPCPFCGGEAHAYKNNLWHVACERAHNGCVTMSAFITEAEAIEAWNTRYHSEFEKTVIKAWGEIKDYQERTCERIVHGLERDREIATVSWTCSECHAHLGSDYRYCPNCGARVIGGTK